MILSNIRDYLKQRGQCTLSDIALHFDTDAGYKYGVDYRDSMTEGIWLPLVSEPDYPPPDGWSAIATGTPMSIVDTNAMGQAQRFYQLKASN